MQRYLRQQNIARLEHCLQSEENTSLRLRILASLRAEKRALALLDAATFGLHPGNIPMAGAANGRPPELKMLRSFRESFEAAGQAYLLLDPRAGLHIVDANAAYQRLTMTSSAIYGRRLFEVFPDNPADSAAEGVFNLFGSLREAALRGETRYMPVQRYDIRDHAGRFVERHWSDVNMPIFDENDRLAYLLHHTVDVTDRVLAAHALTPAAMRPARHYVNGTEH